jgi:hypothetical protein
MVEVKVGEPTFFISSLLPERNQIHKFISPQDEKKPHDPD